MVGRAGGSTSGPLVVLLGWTCCRQQHLDKYKAIYRQIGLEPAALIPPAYDAGYVQQPARVDHFYRRVFRPLVDNDGEQDILVHALSMNGNGAFAQIWHRLGLDPQGEQVKRRVKGWILDSAPIPMRTLPQMARVHVYELLNAQENPAAAQRSLATRISDLARFQLQKTLKRPKEEQFYLDLDNYGRLMSFADLPQQQLYLYSTHDQLTRAADIERFRAHQQSLGKAVHWKCWPDSRHVAHFQQHPVEYAELCVELLEQATARQFSRHNIGQLAKQ